MPKPIREARSSVAVQQATDKSGNLLVSLINPGWGSSGYYSPEVLEAAATDRVFPAGTQMYINHPTESEKAERPVRDVRDLTAVLVEDAVWDGADLVAPVTMFGPYGDTIKEMGRVGAIGISIRASGEMSEGEADGRKGAIVDKIIEGVSADFVTNAGRGGRILEVLESMRPGNVNDKAVSRGVEESTVNDRREALSEFLKEAYGAEKVWVWLRDFDETTCWFDIDTPDDTGTWQQTYTTGETDLISALTGDKQEVRAVTQFVPVNPAGQQETEESKEDTMAKTEIEESVLAQLKEDAGRVTTLETERDTAVKERDEAITESATVRDATRKARAGEIILEAASNAGVKFNEFEVKGLKSELPVVEGALDEDAFTKIVEEAAAKRAEDNGAGRVRNNGIVIDSEITDKVLAEAQAAAFGRKTGV